MGKHAPARETICKCITHFCVTDLYNSVQNRVSLNHEERAPFITVCEHYRHYRDAINFFEFWFTTYSICTPCYTWLPMTGDATVSARITSGFIQVGYSLVIYTIFIDYLFHSIEESHDNICVSISPSLFVFFFTPFEANLVTMARFEVRQRLLTWPSVNGWNLSTSPIW